MNIFGKTGNRKKLIGRKGLNRYGRKALITVFSTMVGKWIGIYLKQTGKKVEELDQEKFVDAAIAALFHQGLNELVFETFDRFYGKEEKKHE